MEFHLNKTDGNSIQSCETDAVIINNTRYTRSLIVSSNKFSDWSAVDAESLSDEVLAEIIPFLSEGDVLLLGIGVHAPSPRPQWQRPFIRYNISLELMSVRAACRTYNILASDQRPVVAALLLGG